MVRIIMEGATEITLQLDNKKVEDMKILSQIKDLLKQQPNCQKCKNFYLSGGLNHSLDCCCKITTMENGNLAYFGHPHHDLDASKCEYYEEKNHGTTI